MGYSDFNVRINGQPVEDMSHDDIANLLATQEGEVVF